MLNSPEIFATSLVSLALTRNGYATSKNVLLGNNKRADLVVTQEKDGVIVDRFIVEVKALNGVRKLSYDSLKEIRKTFEKNFGLKTYIVLFNDADNLLLLDDNLHKMMRDFGDDEITVKLFDRPSDSIENPEPEPGPEPSSGPRPK